MENVGRPLDLELVDLKVPARQQQLPAVANQQTDRIAGLRKPRPLPAPVAILQLHLKLAATPAQLIGVADRKHHARDVGGDIHTAVGQ